MKNNIATMGNFFKDGSLSRMNTLQSLEINEPFWCQRLAALHPLKLPFDIPHKIAEPRWAISPWQSPSPHNDQEEPWRILLQAFVIYLARLTQQETFQIGWYVASNENRSDLASVVPMDIRVTLDKTWRWVTEVVDEELALLAQHQTFRHGLLSHSSSPGTIPELSPELSPCQPWLIAVSVIQDDQEQTAAGELLTIQINRQGGFRWIYDENRLSAEMIDRINEHLQVLLLSKGMDDDVPVGQLNLLPEAERTLLLETWNPTDSPYPDAVCIHQLFEQQVQKTPQATALEYQGQHLSYAELNARANRLAHQLIALGVEPEQRVAICVTRSPAMVLSLLAVLKAGGAYIPLDISYPAARLAYILNDSAPSVIMADEAGQSALGDERLAGLTVFDPTVQPDQPDSNPSVLTLTPQHLAYVIYTSGSTGQPKGVMVEHQAVYHRTLGFNDIYAVTTRDRVLQFSSFAFDASVEEIFSSLCNGATLVIRDDSWLASASTFVTLARQHHITVMSLPTLFWSELAIRDRTLLLPDCLRLIIIGGEQVKKSAIQAWFTQATPFPRLLNTYGPTENTVIATCQEIFSPEDASSIGRPVIHTRIYLLDAGDQPVPLGAVGELYIGGVGVARGYLNRPELTTERFLADPFSNNPDARLYRTGDMARYLPDGNLAFLGRRDQQVKIRGFRIELGEIETRLQEHPAVNQAAVLALDDGQSKRLVAYIVVETVAEADETLVNSLHTYLRALLPDYMVPAAFVRLNRFPQTPNGKLDRRALPAPDKEAFVRQTYDAPQGKEETILAAVWGELLGIEQISRHDNFFALGGHSLLAMRMIEHLRHQGLTLAASDLFQWPVLSELAKTLGQHRAIEIPPNVITPATQQLTPEMLPLAELTPADIDHIVGQVPGGVANIQDIYALSPLQDGILFHHLLAREGDPYLLTNQMVFADRALLDRYLAAMQRIIERHDILRTAFIWQGVSVPVQVVCRHASLPVTVLALNPADGPVIDQLGQRFDPRHYRLDLSQPPLLHFVVAQETDGRWFLLELNHHLIGDHEALEMIHREVQLYLTGQEESLPVPVPFRNLVAQARLGVSQEAHTHFFTEMLAEVEEPTLPFGLTAVHHDGSQVTEFHRMLAPALNDRLRTQARRVGVSLAALCHLAWAQVLSRTSGQKKVVFGTVLFGRMTGGEGTENGMGLFINTLPLRLEMDDTPIRDSVQATHRRLAALLAHEHASLALAQQCSGVAGGTPLFSALLNYRHNALLGMSGELVSGIEFVGEQERTNYPFVLSVEDFGEALGLTVQIAQPVEPERVYGYMQQALESLVDALEHTPDMPVRALDILPAAERTLLLTTWNTTATPYPESLCIHQLFEQQAEKTPQATALIAGNDTLSYRELNTQANQLTHQLIRQGVCPGDPVVLLFERSMALVVAQLAVLKAGAVYVPLDPGVPDERKNWLISDCSAKLLLTDTQTDIPADLVVPLLRLSDENKTAGEQNSINLDLPRAGTELAYIMYTSGSTGTPKGVLVPHRAVVRLVINNGYAAIAPDDRVAFTANPAFDASTFEVWAPLLNGGTLVVIDHTTLLTPAELVQSLQARRVTVLWLTIGLFNRLAPALSPVLPQIKTLIFGGDIPDLLMITQVLQSPPQHLLQAYGPTEGTTFTTIYPIEALAPGMIRVPIGRPIANTRVYLLDSHGQPVPLGVAGEIYVGGDGVAEGYLNRPELTAERFLADPFSESPGARLYRTGDMARYRPDGNLEFLGRNDQQVKIRGFRIEPGEIEIRLAEHPAVREATVLVLGDGEDKRLVAYVVADVDEELVNSLRTHLSAVVPDYMVPAAFVRLDAFPLTPNGKLDRRALPAPDHEAFARQAYAAPQGEMEITLTTIWGEILGIKQISRHDSFFALGGHSLLAVRIIERLRQQGLALTARDLFRSPILSELAQMLEPHQSIAIPTNVITPATRQLIPAMLPLADLTQADIDHIIGQVPGGVANIQDIYALSPLQDGILFHHLLSQQGDPYLLVDQMAFADRTLLDRYLAAIQRVVDRHDILRTAFIWQNISVPVQVVWRQAPLSVTELTLDPVNGPVSRQLDERFNINQYRLDLSDAPLLRFVVAQEADGRWIVLQLQHHLIGDHETVEVMYREVQACLAGQTESLAAPVPYRNLVAQARLGVSQEAHTRFFTEMLAEVEEPTLPFGLAEVYHDGSQETESYRLLAPALNDRLRSQARRFGVSLAAVCHLAWAQVLSRTSGQEKVVFGTVLFGRMTGGEGAEGGMGLFINTLPLRLDIDDTPVRDSVQATHRRLAELLAHEHASLALAQQCSSVERGTPLFSALLNYRHNSPSNPLDNTLDGFEFLEVQERTNYPFGLSVEYEGATLGLTANVVQPFDPDRVCGYMQQALESLADALEHTPDRPVRALEILPEAERTVLLHTWNGTEAAYPEVLCIHQLFEQQAQKTPEATALEYQGQRLSYAELNTCANRLAHQLIALGVEPEQRVAICVARSPAMVVSLLAVLKAGGAYVPLDITYPAERLAYILSDSAPSVLVADRAGQSTLGDKILSGLTVLNPTMQPDQPDSNPQVSALTPQHLAYVIYTSGSTGQPKGVIIEHQAIYQRTLGVNERYGVTAQDRVLQFAAFAFDVSVEECFSSLCHGATLVIRDDNWLTSMPEFIDLARENRITVLFLPTLFWSELAGRNKGLPLPDALRLVIIGSEAVQRKALQDWFAQEGHRPQLLNAYGPTENTVTATCQDVFSPDNDRTIGRPLRNTRIYLLDKNEHPVPLGCVGEIYIGGVGVARGYLNQPALSEECFIPDPFSPVSDARIYRTGDLGRYLPDGNLEFLGRNDQQVKIRGFRIEPREIETRLLAHPTVQEAVVLALEGGQDKRLVAYIVAEADEELANNLRAHLSAVLPDYMVPAAFVRLDSFPQTPNGKLDRRALPVPAGDSFARKAYEAPQGETETALVAIWREVLGVEQISRHDNFLALGGHSLLAMRVMNRIAALGMELPLSELFSSPSLAALAEKLHTRFDQPGSVLPPIMPVPREGILPLSFVQQRLWFLTQFEGVRGRYHMPLLLHLRGQLDIAVWQQALNALFARHEALRSVFVSVDGQPQVQLLPADRGLPLVQHDLRGCQEAEKSLERLRTEEMFAPFDLSDGPLIRTILIRLADDKYQFLLTQHHITSDGWSVKVLIDELNTLYTAFLAGQPDPLPALAIQYPDYAVWQRQWFSAERMQAQSDYWRTTLADAPVLLNLPTDRPRPPEQSFVGQILLINLDAELTAALKRLSEQHGVTLFMTLLSAWSVVLSRLSGQTDIVIETLSAGRSRQEVEPLIGFFVNTLALRTRTPGELTVAELLAQVWQTALGAQAHQDLPFEQVVEIVRPPHRLDHTPLFQVMFAWQDYENPDWTLPGLTVSSVVQEVAQDLNIINHDLEMEFFEQNGRIVGVINYATELFDRLTMERHLDYLLTVLQAMVANPQQRIGEIDILTSAE
ncbi:amino acid adenylation domain-containing protein [Xenorhabdus bovienii]|uniref:non-ribosomal peptide synthetase n=1 Tax=Xenorhabdus bovienii TaxID=40576 RepID=UPI0023AEDB1E|nr:non-ribosomal peptide synthetase [Xenorhabdus bovienii]MDE9478575.1 amino acid adenylation domain-containing protein [Xenorhabdus bovienii]